MFDKITIRVKVSNEEAAHLARIHRLHTWVNDAGNKVEYRSSEYARLTGVEVRIARNTATIKTSLHKFWNNGIYGLRRNDNEFSISEAKSAFEMLLLENGLLPERVKIVEFELGLNMHVSYDPISFIELARYITISDKTMFVDANFRVNRQRTTEKHRDLRKYYKIYDKGFEMRDRRRGGASLQSFPGEQGSCSPDYILRIETVYRRHSEYASTFFKDSNVNRLAERFYADWKDLFFFKEVRAEKGARKSELDSAEKIINFGSEEYLLSVKKEYDSGRLSDKQYRTIREFVRDFKTDSKRFKVLISPQEYEYKRLLKERYESARR